MEQHPVPRNISGFQFHLIGDMTLRQFGYLASGVAIGYLIYRTAPFSAIINIPLALSCGLSGFAFAFLPIQERPLDRWLLSFIKSILAPTQYVWYKNNAPPDILTRSLAFHIQVVQTPQQAAAHKETNEKLRAYLATIPTPLHESLNTAEKRYIDRTMALFQTTTSVKTPSLPSEASSFIPFQPPVNKSVPQEKETVGPKEEVISLPEQVKEAVATPQPIPAINENHAVWKTQLSQMAAEKEALEKELKKLQQQLSSSTTSQAVKPTSPQQSLNEPTIKVVSPKSVVPDMGMLNIQQSPNLIAGIIKDPQKKLLPNIILTIKDKNGLPVRALKTNKLGQFTTATPLPNGAYLLEVEDPMKRYVFDIAAIALSGKVFLPIEIIARGEKELMREKLSKELFGSATM